MVWSFLYPIFKNISWFVHIPLLLYFTLLRVFYTSVNWWFSTGVCWDNKSPRVFRTLLSILADLNKVVVRMVSTSLIFKSSFPSTNPLVTVPNSLIAISITVTLMFHSFFSSLARSRYFSLFSLSFSFTLWSAGIAKSTPRQVTFSSFFFFFLTITNPGRD